MTLAEVYRARAENAATQLGRQRYREEARAVLSTVLADRRSDEYARVTLVKLGIDEVRDLLSSATTSDRELDDAIRRVDRSLTEALQQHPEEQYLLSAEADLSALVADDERSLKALLRASAANKRDPYIANRLARALFEKGDVAAAKETLHVALEGSRGDMRLNFQYAEMLRKSGETDPNALAYYYERAFTPGDRNYEAQFWFARFGFQSGDRRLADKSSDTFRALRSAAMSHSRKVEVRDTIRDGGRDHVFQGTAERVEQSYGKLRRDGPGDLIFVHSDKVSEETWAALKTGDRVCFVVGFSFSGPTAVGLEVLSV